MSLQYKKFLVFDTETEGLNLHLSRPWQVSYMVFDHTKEIEEFDRYIWWNDLKVSEGAAIVTRFDYDKYKSKAEDREEVFDHFNSYLQNPEYGLVGHNILNFDTYMLSTWARLANRKLDNSYVERCIDTNALARGLKGNIAVDKDKLLFWQYKILNERMKVKTSQGLLLKEYEIPHDPERLHDGLYDIKMTKELFYKLRYQLN